MDEIDVQLIVAARDGDSLAMNRLFQRCYPRVYAIGLRYFGEDQRAADISQQACLQMQRKLGQLSDPGSFRTWLYRIVMNCCHEEARSRSRRLNLMEKFRRQPHAASAPAADRTLLRDEQRRQVLDALQRIPSEQREVIIMKEYEELTFREIAALLELSENTVKSRLYYGLKAMRKLLGEAGNLPD